MIRHRDDWSERELMEAEGYAVTCTTVFEQWLKELQALEVQLPKDKRAAVEISSLLDMAAKLTDQHLQFADDDFANAARVVYRQLRDKG